jgi:hypothetical protein
MVLSERKSEIVWRYPLVFTDVRLGFLRLRCWASTFRDVDFDITRLIASDRRGTSEKSGAQVS